MNLDNRIAVAVVGMGFGAEFVPIYLDHPQVAQVWICDSDPARLAAIGERFPTARRAGSLADILANPAVDAVHLVTPIPLHARQAVEVLTAGKHCACTVPMAASLADLQAVVDAQRWSGKHYMMMETAVYTREFLYVRERVRRGDFGRIQFLRGAHYQDMENWPDYWLGLPPMHYATHALAPLLALAGTRAETVRCLGSGVMRSELRAPYGNPYPVESALFKLAGADLAAEVTRSLFHTARGYSESFNVYGEALTFEWQQVENEEPVLFSMAALQPGRGRPIATERITVPDYARLLPPEIGKYTRRFVYNSAQSHLSFEQGGGHGGSHPHLVHEFITSITTGRPPYINATVAADWTAAGICAHESAMRAGAEVVVPAFTS
ncbi:MAG: Gfo/Idh/MocA family protein [Anaerolineae bacterium]